MRVGTPLDVVTDAVDVGPRVKGDPSAGWRLMDVRS